MHSHPDRPQMIQSMPLGSFRNGMRVAVLALVMGLTACAQPPPGVGDAQQYPGFERRIVGAVEFGFDTFRIRPQSYALLDNVAVAMNDPRLAGLFFEINGHTDITGRLGYNISLSMLRATAVAEYLAARGVPRERMRPQGFGPLQPINAYDPRSPSNRRVEIVAMR